MARPTSRPISRCMPELYLQGRLDLDDLYVSKRIVLRDVETTGTRPLKDGSLTRLVVTSF